MMRWPGSFGASGVGRFASRSHQDRRRSDANLVSLLYARRRFVRSEGIASMPDPVSTAPRSKSTAWARGFGGAALIVAISTLIAAAMLPHFELSNLTMVFLLGVVVTAVAFGRGPAIFAALLAVAV